jgi:lipoprotein NlpI
VIWMVLADINKSLALDPKNAEAYCNLGLVSLTQGNQADGNQNLEKCFRLDGTLRPRFEAAAKNIKKWCPPKKNFVQTCVLL